MKDYEEKQMQVYEQGKSYLDKLSNLTITDETTAIEIGDARKQVSGIIKEIEKERKEIVQPLNEAVKKTNAFFKKVSSPYATLKVALSDKLLQWEKAQQATRAMAEAALEATTDEDPEEIKALLVASVAQAKRAKGIKVRKTWDFEVTDIDQVPKEYLLLDVCKRSVLARVKDGIREIPGLRIFQKESISE